MSLWACHDGQPRFCRPILAIAGGTRLGKSMLAAHALTRAAKKLSLDDFLEVTVEDSEQMDLADFDRRVHAGVLLDGVGDALFLFMKPSKAAPRFCGRAVVATFDLSAQNLGELHADH